MGQRAMSRRRRRANGAVLWAATGAAVAAAWSPPARAATSDWNVNSGNWSVPGNWNPNGVPATGTDVTITNADAVNRTITFDFTYASSGMGSFLIENTNATILGQATLSIPAGSNRFATIGGQSVADSGRGTFNQAGGTNVAGQFLYLATATSGVGAYTLSGAATLNVLGNEVVGYGGKGTFTQNAGTHTVGDNLTIGYSVLASGTATLSAGTLNVTHDAFVGNDGVGVLNQSGTFSGTVGGNLVLGRDSGGNANGTYNLSGGTMTVSGQIQVGLSASGAVLQTGGSLVTTNSLLVGYAATGIGSYTINNANSRLTVGDEWIGYLGNGALIQNGGTHTASSFTMAADAGASAVAAMSGGLMTIANNSYVGLVGNATFTQSGGTHTAGSILAVGNAAGKTGTYTLSNGTVSSNDMRVGLGGVGKFLQSGGAVTANGAGLVLGQDVGGSGTYAMSNTASLTVNGDEFVGLNGLGLFNQTGGAHNVAHDVFIGYGASANGQAILQAGNWGVGNAAYIGYDGVGSFNQSGGTFNATVLVSVGGLARADGTFSLAGGVATTPSLDIGYAGHGTVLLAGGTMSASVVTVFQNGTLTLAGANTATMNVTNGGVVNVTGNATLATLSLGISSATRVDANLTMTGALTDDLGAPMTGTGRIVINAGGALNGWGVVTPGVTNNATITGRGGTLLLAGPAFVNSGTVQNSVGTDVLIRATSVTNAGNIVVNAAGSVTFNAPILVSTNRTVTLLGGALATTGLTNSFFGQVNGFGQLVGPLTNDGLITTTGPTQFIGNVTNTSNGVITARNSQLLITGTTNNSGTIRVQAGGSVVFVGALTGNPLAGGVPVGTAILESSTAMLASSYQAQALTLTGTSGQPNTYPTATVRPAAEGGQTSVLGALVILQEASGVPRGRLDLADNALIVNYPSANPSPITSIRGNIVSAYAPAAASHWTGTGLTSGPAAADSSRALGYAEATEVLGAAGGSFRGQAADASSVLVRYTLAGDATLDGAIDFNDLVRLAQNYNTTVSATTNSWWFNGDFTYDGVCDFNDLVKLAQNYNTALPGAPVPGAPAGFDHDLAAAFAAVPEPSTGGAIFAIAGAAALARRRRRPSAAPTVP